MLALAHAHRTYEMALNHEEYCEISAIIEDYRVIELSFDLYIFSETFHTHCKQDLDKLSQSYPGKYQELWETCAQFAEQEFSNEGSW